MFRHIATASFVENVCFGDTLPQGGFYRRRLISDKTSSNLIRPVVSEFCDEAD